MITAYSTIKDLKRAGRRTLGCFPLYPPLELLHSMGFTPVVLWGLRDLYREVPLSDRHLQTYTCSVGRCLTEFMLRHGGELFDGIVMYNACDTLRNLPEILQLGLAGQGQPLPLFRLHIPTSSLEKPADRLYLTQRIHRLIQELEESFNISFSAEAFRDSVDLYRRQRALAAGLQELVGQGRLTVYEFYRMMNAGQRIPVEEHLAMLETAIERYSAGPPADQASPRVIVSGILPPPAGIIDCIAAAGLRVVDNDIAMWKRSYGYSPAAFDDPGEYYIDMFRHHYPCTTVLPTGDARMATLLKMVREKKIDGCIFIGEKFCEYEYFEVPYLKKILEGEDVRLLCLDFSLEDYENLGPYQTRIEGFAEILRG